MPPALAAEAVHDVIASLLAHVHDDKPEIERDHQSLILTARVMHQAIPGGGVDRVERIWPIGDHSICEFVRDDGVTAYASLLSTDSPRYRELREFLKS